MFVGHFAGSVLVKAVRPTLPFWACVGAAQLIDIGWAGLVIAGIEKLRLDPALPGSPLDLYFMPYTHSLPMAALWSLVAGWLAVRAWGGPGWWIGVVVFSHWLGDLLVHRPDLPLGLYGPKVGLGLWNLPALEIIVELGLLGLAMCIWIAARKQARREARPATGWFVAVLVLAAVNAIPGDPPSPAGMAMLALFGYGLAIAVAWLVDRADRRR